MKKQIMKSFTLLMSLGLGLASANQSLEEQKQLDERVESLESRKGLEVFGVINGEFMRSEVYGLANMGEDPTQIGFVDPYAERMEKKQVTWLDLGLNFRPYETTQAKAIVRFSQDWQTFFASRSRPVSVRWLSMDGKFNKMISYNVGDFKQKYSPLTLWTPELEFIMEPKIFARDREELQYEHFLGDNERVLQGANVNFTSGSLGDVAEVRLDGLFSRVRRSEFLDAQGKQGQEAGYKSDFENLVAATQLEALFIDNIFVGGGFLYNYDQEGTYLFEDQIDQEAFGATPGAPGTTISQNGQSPTTILSTQVTSVKAGVDIAGFVGLDFLKAEILAEVANSKQKQTFASAAIEAEDANVLPEDLNGQALWAELGLGYESEIVNVNSTTRMIQNNDKFRNPFAQSTSFVGERILNSSNDNSDGTLYSTLDALYHGVSHYSPTSYETTYQAAPYEKNSYTNSIQYGNVNQDPAVQATLPSGLATANRKGLTENLSVDAMNGGVKVEVAYKALEINNPVETSDASNSYSTTAKYTQIGAGVGSDLGQFIPNYEFPLEISGAFTQDVTKSSQLITQNSDGAVLYNGETTEYISTLVQSGAYFKVHRLFALLGGWQQLTKENNQLSGSLNKFKTVESYWRAGGEFVIGDNAYFITSAGLLTVEQTNDTPDPVDANLRTVSNGDFTQFITQFKIRADF